MTDNQNLTASRDPRAGVVMWRTRNRVRHIGWGPLDDPVPLCTARNRKAFGWSASAAADVHELPICRDCQKRLNAMNRAVRNGS